MQVLLKDNQFAITVENEADSKVVGAIVSQILLSSSENGKPHKYNKNGENGLKARKLKRGWTVEEMGRVLQMKNSGEFKIKDIAAEMQSTEPSIYALLNKIRTENPENVAERIEKVCLTFPGVDGRSGCPRLPISQRPPG